MFKLSNVSKSYHTKAGIVQALNGVSLSLPDNGMVFLLGKSGSGKSTLLNILGGLDSISSGEILYNGCDIGKLSASQQNDYRNNNIGFIFQDYNLIDEYDVASNIGIALALQNNIDSKSAIYNALKAVDLEEYGKRKTSELSGGQKQRIAIARVLAKNSNVILADEPTGNLDSENATEIFEILKAISKTKLVVVVSHDEESAAKYGDRIINIKDGIAVNDTKIGDNQVTAISTCKYTNSHHKVNGKYIGVLTRLSLKNMWGKKFRLITAIILTALSLIFLGIALTSAFYDKYTVSYNAYKDIGLNEIRFNPLLDASLDEIQKSYPDYEFDKLYYRTYFKYKNIDMNTALINEQKMEKYDMSILLGKLPIENNEFCISRHMADKLIKTGDFASYEELLQNFIIPVENDYEFMLVGILETPFTQLYQTYKSKNRENFLDMVEHDFQYSLSSAAMVGEKFFDIWKFNIESNILNLELFKLRYPEATIYYKSGYSTVNKGEVVITKKAFADILGIPSSYIEDPLVYLNAQDYYIDIKFEFNNYSESRKLKVVGISNKTICNNTDINEVGIENEQLGNGVLAFITALNGNIESDKRIIVDSENDNYMSVIYFDLSRANEFASLFQKIGFTASIIFGLFAAILIANLTISSMNSNKKQIGILRAMGMSNKGIGFIFILESVFVILLSLIISLICIPIAINIFIAEFNFNVNFLLFGANSVLILIAMGLGISLASSMIPIIAKSKIPPVQLLK